MSEHLETLDVHCRFSPFAAVSSTSTRIAARCCHRSNAPGGLTTLWICLMHVCTVHVNRAALGRTSKGERGKEWPEANDRPDDTASIGQSIAGLHISRDGRTTRCRRSRRCTTTQQLGPTSSAPMPSGQTSSLLPHHATSQAQSLCITAAAWRWSSAPSWQRTHPCLTLVRDARA